MTEIRRFNVKPLARVEGEGALRVRVTGEAIEIAEFNIYEPPRFFEKLLVGREVREVPDITARVCGICPVAYQMSSCQALEKALGISVTPEIKRLRQLLYCGEWLQSHGLHVHLLHAPDFLGFESGFAMAATYPQLVENGLKLKALGNRLVEVVGGRAVHPINVTVGGFYKAPSPAAIRSLVPELEWGLETCLALVDRVARFDCPVLEVDYESVALQHDTDYPMNEGLVVSSGSPRTAALRIPVEDFARHFVERQVPHSTALHSVRRGTDTPYLTGPVARMNLCRDQLPPRAARAADACGLEQPMRNPYRSIVARVLEMAAACEIAARIAGDASAEISPCRIDYEPAAGSGCHATEAPRGLLYHRYRLDERGLVAEAEIIPPTSQNQAQVEEDLRGLLPEVLKLDDAEATRRCEMLIRSYDPCISCATHFLTLSIDRASHGRQLS
jgi:sulfhydrogenase subunit alpha